MRSGARFIIAIALAAVLGGWLAYVSLGGTLEQYVNPGQLTASNHTTYRLDGLVAAGAPADAAGLAQAPSGLRFRVQDKKNPQQAVTVLYRGSVPDAFRVGREVVVTGKMTDDGVFEARRDSLITLCPSKFQSAPDSNASAGGATASS